LCAEINLRRKRVCSVLITIVKRDAPIRGSKSDCSGGKGGKKCNKETGSENRKRGTNGNPKSAIKGQTGEKQIKTPKDGGVPGNLK